MRLTKFPDYESSVRSSSTLNVRHYALSIWSLVAVFRNSGRSVTLQNSDVHLRHGPSNYQ